MAGEFDAAAEEIALQPGGYLHAIHMASLHGHSAAQRALLAKPKHCD
jgi:hypothetical protein